MSKCNACNNCTSPTFNTWANAEYPCYQDKESVIQYEEKKRLYTIELQRRVEESNAKELRKMEIDKKNREIIEGVEGVIYSYNQAFPIESHVRQIIIQFESGLAKSAILGTAEGIHTLAQDILHLGVKCFGGQPPLPTTMEEFLNQTRQAAERHRRDVEKSEKALVNVATTFLIPPTAKALLGATLDFHNLQEKWPNLDGNGRAYELGSFVGTHVLADQVAHKIAPQAMEVVDKIPTLIMSNL